MKPRIEKKAEKPMLVSSDRKAGKSVFDKNVFVLGFAALIIVVAIFFVVFSLKLFDVDVVSPNGKVTVEVKDSFSSKPMTFVRVDLVKDGKSFENAYTDVFGKAELEDVSPGKYVIVAKKKGFIELWDGTVQVSPGSRISTAIKIEAIKT